MILVDANLLVYAVNRDAEAHGPARRWLTRVLNGRETSETVGLAWVTILAFLRLATRTGILERPLPVRAACELVEGWLALPNVVVVHPGVRHLAVLRRLLEEAGAGGNLTMDAHLAALAIENHAEVCTADRDFGRFGGVRWRNPIAAS